MMNATEEKVLAKWRRQLHRKFAKGVKSSASGECRCPLCMRDWDYMCDWSAEIEMEVFSLQGKLRAALKRANRK